MTFIYVGKVEKFEFGGEYRKFSYYVLSGVEVNDLIQKWKSELSTIEGVVDKSKLVEYIKRILSEVCDFVNNKVSKIEGIYKPIDTEEYRGISCETALIILKEKEEHEVTPCKVFFVRIPIEKKELNIIHTLEKILENEYGVKEAKIFTNIEKVYEYVIRRIVREIS